jgi:hypothetical protein
MKIYPPPLLPTFDEIVTAFGGTHELCDRLHRHAPDRYRKNPSQISNWRRYSGIPRSAWADLIALPHSRILLFKGRTRPAKLTLEMLENADKMFKAEKAKSA